jgi:hypothetical protein
MRRFVTSLLLGLAIAAALTRRSSPTAPAGSVSDYDLAIDSQAAKLVELKQKLTYFLVTAAVGVIVFGAKFLLDWEQAHPPAAAEHPRHWLIAAGVSALLACGCALISVQLGHTSFTMHVSFRYRRQTSLPPALEERWDRVSTWQTRFLAASAGFLVAEIALVLAYFRQVLW